MLCHNSFWFYFLMSKTERKERTSICIMASYLFSYIFCITQQFETAFLSWFHVFHVAMGSVEIYKLVTIQSFHSENHSPCFCLPKINDVVLLQWYILSLKTPILLQWELILLAPSSVKRNKMKFPKHKKINQKNITAIFLYFFLHCLYFEGVFYFYYFHNKIHRNYWIYS